MALLVLLGALFWVQRVVFRFGYFILSSGCFCFVGSWGPAVLFVGPVFVLVLGFREEGVGPKG